jgi:hypothetical protein
VAVNVQKIFTKQQGGTYDSVGKVASNFIDGQLSVGSNTPHSITDIEKKLFNFTV